MARFETTDSAPPVLTLGIGLTVLVTAWLIWMEASLPAVAGAGLAAMAAASTARLPGGKAPDQTPPGAPPGIRRCSGRVSSSRVRSAKMPSRGRAVRRARSIARMGRGAVRQSGRGMKATRGSVQC